jgi:2,6-dihydroxypyridine 3-monooxygenase
MRVAVVGGSIGGLTAALLMRDAGYDVDVYERSTAEQAGYGAGIVVHEATVRYLRERSTGDPDALSVAAPSLRYLDMAGAVAYEQPRPYRTTSWGALYRALLGLFDAGRYHRGHQLVSFAQDDRSVQALFAGGASVEADLLVCADGIASTTRRLLFPAVEPRYAGYVGWRGTAAADALPEAIARCFSAGVTYALLPSQRSHIVAYPIPGGLFNLVWYRNVAAGPELERLMTDRDGTRRAFSVPAGAVREEAIAALRRAARELLPPQFGELVARAPQPFVQLIVDVEGARTVCGRVCLIGDAAFTVRPHTASGTAKAAEDAWMLADALARERDLASALAAWELRQRVLGRRLVARNRELGNRSQVDGTWEPCDVYGLREVGDYVTNDPNGQPQQEASEQQA